MYHTDHFGKGPVKYRDVIGSIGVLESPDNHMPIGIAKLPDVGRSRACSLGSDRAGRKDSGTVDYH
jgi:hypothetical protein